MALGRLEDPLDGDCVLVQAHDGDGQLRGFLSFVPWGRNGLSLDLMRRDPAADNGLVELMVTGLAEHAARVRGRPGFAELRDVPRGVRARRRDRCRSARAAVASGAAAGQPQLAAGVALPLEREVPPDLAAALHVLRVHLGPSPGRHGRGQRRGLPDPAVARACSAARAPSGGRPGDRRSRARCRGHGADPAAAGPAGRGAVGRAAPGAGAGTPGEAGPDPGRGASIPTR